jgi:hypothetical protein
MAKSSSLDGLIKWAGREEWSALFEEVVDEHFGEVCETWGVEPGFEQLGEVLGEETAMTLWGCAFEDFLTRPDEDGERTIVDDFLKRRGWKESVSNRRYMEALRDSVMSLYEVSDVVPGESFLARDMILGGEPVRVSEQSASRVLKQWDRIAVRIVKVSGRHVMSGGLLLFSHDLADELLDVAREEIEAAKGPMEDALAEAGPVELSPDGELPDSEEMLKVLFLATAAPLITSLWLDEALERALGADGADMVNSDGDAVVPHMLRFALKDGVTVERLRERLRGVPTFREEDENFWNWVDGDDAVTQADGAAGGPAGERKGRVYRVTMDDGAEVLGNVAIEDGELAVYVNSESRAGLARAILHDLASDLLGTPVVTVDAAPADRDGDEAESAISEEEKAELLGRFLHQHYEETLDQPIPMLDGMTPREAAARPDSRAKVAGWLKYIENGSARMGTGGEIDFSWMWKELGLEDLRG